MKPSPSGGQKAIAKVSHFKGKDPSKWVKDLSTFNTVDMGEVYKGIRLNLQAHGRNVEKIFHVQPGADPKSIQLTVEGANDLRLTQKGELEVKSGTRSMRFTRPVAYQHIDGKKTPVDVNYTVKGKSYGFQVAAYDRTRELIIDPLITAIFQGTSDEYTMPKCMAADSQGNIYLAGHSARQLVVFKFDSRLETLLSSANYGSGSWSRDGNPSVYDIKIDSQDAVYIAGGTEDENFPITEGSFDTVLQRGDYYYFDADGFVIKYNANLNTILASTFIRGANEEKANVLGIDVNNEIVLTIMDQTLTTLIGSTYLGGSWDDHASAIIVNNNDIIVAGETRSGTFPYMIETTGYSDAFVCRFNADETPESLPSAGPGYWLSDETGSADSIHLDVNICDDGSFSGQWRMYFCFPLTICGIADEFEPNPVSGTIDFDNSTGTIDISDDCTNVPFVIFQQNDERLVLKIDPGGTDSSCSVEDFWSFLYYQGECEAGTCEDPVDPAEDDSDPNNEDDQNDDGGGGGGCFASALIWSVEWWNLYILRRTSIFTPSPCPSPPRGRGDAVMRESSG